MAALLPLLIRFWPYLAAAAFVFGAIGYHKKTVLLAHHAGYVEGESDVEAQWDADKAKKAKAIAALALQWDNERQRADESSRLLDEAHRARFAPVETAAHALPAAVASIRVPAAAVRVLDLASDAANAAGAAGEPARATARPAESADHAQGGADHPIQSGAGTDDGSTTVGDLTAWGVGAAKVYGACRDRVSALIAFYDGVRAAKPEEGKP